MDDAAQLRAQFRGANCTEKQIRELEENLAKAKEYKNQTSGWSRDYWTAFWRRRNTSTPAEAPAE